MGPLMSAASVANATNSGACSRVRHSSGVKSDFATIYLLLSTSSVSLHACATVSYVHSGARHEAKNADLRLPGGYCSLLPRTDVILPAEIFAPQCLIAHRHV